MKISIGSAKFGFSYGFNDYSSKISKTEVEKILNFSIKNNINSIDTAIDYGETETILGNIGVDKFNITTKIPSLSKNIKNIDNWVQKKIYSSLERLKIKKIKGVLLHNPSQLLNNKGSEIYSSLKNLKQKGLINKIGYSIYTTDELESLYDSFFPDIVQFPFNIFDQRIIKSGWLKKLRKDGVETQARSIFLKGTLLINTNKLPNYFNKWIKHFKYWHDWLSQNNLKPLEAALIFVSQKKDINEVIVGLDNLEQLKQIIDCLNTKIKIPNFDYYVNDEKLLNPSKW